MSIAISITKRRKFVLTVEHRWMLTMWLIALLVLWSGTSFAQEIEATVTVNTDLLPPEEIPKLETFRSDLEYYINNSRFTDQQWEGVRIPVHIDVHFTSGREGQYQARLYISAERYVGSSVEHRTILAKFIETKWRFEYWPNTILTYQPNRFDPLSSVIDFYMLLVIGMDADSYSELGGTPYYQQAYRIWELGNAAQYGGFERSAEPGQYSKYQIVAEMTSVELEDFRLLFFQYYADGVDQLLRNRTEAQSAIDEILSDMVRWKHRFGKPSALLQLFFDARYLELIDLFADYPNRQRVVQKLQYLDPGHSLDYQRLLE